MWPKVPMAKGLLQFEEMNYCLTAMRHRRVTADPHLLARRFVASGCLVRLCWRAYGFGMFLLLCGSLLLACLWLWHALAVVCLLWPCYRRTKEQWKVRPARLQLKRPRPRKSTSGSSKFEARGVKIASWKPSGGLREALGRQVAGKTAPKPRLGGSWGRLGGS